jgi:hypothetical protein
MFLLQSLLLKSCSPSSSLPMAASRLKAEVASPLFEEESSGEEDDILDAIAEWQENEH